MGLVLRQRLLELWLGLGLVLGQGMPAGGMVAELGGLLSLSPGAWVVVDISTADGVGGAAELEEALRAFAVVV